MVCSPDQAKQKAEEMGLWCKAMEEKRFEEQLQVEWEKEEKERKKEDAQLAARLISNY